MLPSTLVLATLYDFYGRNDSDCWGGLRTGKSNVLDDNDASQKDGSEHCKKTV